ncbi:hypothetical protein IPM19_04610 [bacterium]|nr:MAG: hypothetical protein IPM19_04610 [bacterium]
MKLMASSNRLLLFRPKDEIFSSKSFFARMSLCFLVAYSVCDKLPANCKSSKRSSFVSISTSSSRNSWAKELSAWAVFNFSFSKNSIEAFAQAEDKETFLISSFI